MPQLDIVYPEGISFEHNYWENTFFKLQVANCVQYEKIIFLDSDMIIMDNIDHLFEKEHGSAVAAGNAVNWDYNNLNSGLMVIMPNKNFYNVLISNIQAAMVRRFNQGYNVSDQDVFQENLSDWTERDELHLPEKYNCYYHEMYQVCKKLKYKHKDIYVIHFSGAIKPWSGGHFS